MMAFPLQTCWGCFCFAHDVSWLPEELGSAGTADGSGDKEAAADGANGAVSERTSIEMLAENSGMEAKVVDTIKALEPSDMEKVEKYRAQARRLAGTYCAFLAEEASETKLSTAIGNTAVGRIRGDAEDCFSL